MHLQYDRNSFVLLQWKVEIYENPPKPSSGVISFFPNGENMVNSCILQCMLLVWRILSSQIISILLHYTLDPLLPMQMYLHKSSGAQRCWMHEHACVQFPMSQWTWMTGGIVLDPWPSTTLVAHSGIIFIEIFSCCISFALIGTLSSKAWLVTVFSLSFWLCDFFMWR